MRALDKPTLSLLSRLWLSEPDAEALARAREAGLSAAADPPTLAAAWTDLFLLNVYPYGAQALVRPRASGSALLRATSEGKTGQATITVH